VSRALGTAAVAALCALAAAGCGLGAGENSGEVELTVTRDYGSELLIREAEPISESDTVIRVLDRAVEVETRYGGGFVQSIDGLAGGESGGRRSDWFFYINGIESPIGAAEFELADGDRVWWDHRDWTAAMRVPAVVGSWPEPFLHGFRRERYATELRCLGPEPPCADVSARLVAEGVEASEPRPDADRDDSRIRVLVGPWNRVREDREARLIEEGPSRSGVFATFTAPGRVVLTLLNARGDPAGTLGRGAGLVAALRPDDGAPTWVVTGTDPAGVEAAAEALGDPLGDRYAVAVDDAGPIGVPVP
jgi:hypothetical protein